MEAITHAQVQEVVQRLPATKLTFAYSLLIDLADREMASQSAQTDFLCLPLSERRRLLTLQAQQMKAHYEQTALERQAWQAGDFVDEY